MIIKPFRKIRKIVSIILLITFIKLDNGYLSAFYQQIQPQPQSQKISASTIFHGDNKNKDLIISAIIMFGLYYAHLGKIKNISVLDGGRDPIKPIKIETVDGKKYVLKPVNNIGPLGREKNKNKADFIVAFNLHLAKQGVQVSKFLKNEKNTYLIEFNGVYFALSEYIEKGKVVSGKNYSRTQHRNRGKLVAEIQNAVASFENPVDDERVRTDFFNPNKLDTIVENIRQSIDKQGSPSLVNFLQQSELYKVNFAKIKDHLLMSYIHSDLNPGNILFEEDSVAVLIDFSCSCYYYRISEFIRIALGGSNQSMKTTYNKAMLKEAIIGFQQTADKPLSDEEIRGIIEFIRFEFLKFSQNASMRKFFVNESFARFVDDFSDEQKISQFIEDINMQVQIDKIKTTAGLLNYCESQQSWWFKNFGIWSWWNLSFILIIPFFIKIVTYFAGPSSIPQQFFDKIISEIKNGINPADYKTSAEFLARVKFIYPEYRNANFPPGTQEADALVNRRIHTDKVITMHHAFVSGNFREIYDYLSPREKAKITFEEYTDFLNIAKAKYDALPLETKKALQEATIFHDYGYKYAAKMNDHGYEGAVRVAEILRGLPNRSLEYIERLKFIILRHGDYGDIEAGGVLPKDILALNQTQQDLLFLVGMFDNMGKPPNYGGNSMTQQMINNYLTLIDRLKEYVKKNEFYKARFDNLLSPANFVGAIPVSIKQKLKDKVEKLVPADKKEAFHHVWNDRIRLDNYAIFSDMYKLRGYDPALIEERCAKLVVIIGEIVMKLDVDIRFDTDINYMLTMDHGTLFQRGIYLEALFDYLDNDRKIPYHLEEVGGQTKVILDLNEMVKKRHLVKRAAKFLVVVNIPAVFLKEITKIAKTLKADSAADFTGMNSDNIQAMLKAV